MTTPTTQLELDAITNAVVASGSPRQKKLAKAALTAFEGGLFTTDNVAAWVSAQKIKAPELFVAKASTNPWSPNFPNQPTAHPKTGQATDQKTVAIENFIRKFGSAASSRMAAGQLVDIAGRKLSPEQQAKLRVA